MCVCVCVCACMSPYVWYCVNYTDHRYKRSQSGVYDLGMLADDTRSASVVEDLVGIVDKVATACVFG
jgi:hypothetical protein